MVSTRYDLGALTVVLVFGTVLTRVLLLRTRGIQAMKFGDLDKTDFLIPPFALLYFYLIFANAFAWPTVVHNQLWNVPWLAWIGVVLCATGFLLMLLSLISFGSSFRVGIDTTHPDQLVTSGIFALTRNPMYVAFACVLIGEFLIYPSWILLIYLVAGFSLFHRQVMREEAYLRAHYGAEYVAYSERVRRYL
jgi:protein-S-isoprenylcysteine O-methyltransferase Ste14